MKIIDTSWKWSGALSGRESTEYIALHHAAAKKCSAKQVDEWHKNNGWSGIGYHFFVRKDGSIYRGRPLWAVGAHVSGKNESSVGICVEGDYSEEKTMPRAQMLSVAELLSYIKAFHYPNAQIVRHKDIGASDCPGRYYPFEKIKDYKKILNESEELSMEQYEELKAEISALRAEFSEKAGYYNYIDDNMNKAYRPTIQRLVDEGIIKGNEKGELLLTNDMMRVIVFCDRMIQKKDK